MIPAPSSSVHHPWGHGYVFHSPGGHFTYRIIGPCCRLFDREQLPWPCCRLQWRGKEPSWRRIGRRLVVDMATRRYPSYSVEIIGPRDPSEPVVMTLYTHKLSSPTQHWWYSPHAADLSPALAPLTAAVNPVEA